MVPGILTGFIPEAFDGVKRGGGERSFRLKTKKGLSTVLEKCEGAYPTTVC